MTVQPILLPDASDEEKAKYEEIWSIPEYRASPSPGLRNVDRFLTVFQPETFGTSDIVDIGCGTGLAGLEFQKRTTMKAHWVDITDAALDPAVPRSRFKQTPIWQWQPGRTYHYGFCCDVMEHIPPEYVMLSIDRMVQNCDLVWLAICNMEDKMGIHIGEHLHLTVQPFNWWLVRLATVAKIYEGRDLCGNSMFVVGRL